MWCSKCQTELPDRAKLCPECGNDLKKPQESADIAYRQAHSYKPKPHVDKILTVRSTIEGERKPVRVMFADVAGSTTMSGTLGPEQIHQDVAACFRILMDGIRFQWVAHWLDDTSKRRESHADLH